MRQRWKLSDPVLMSAATTLGIGLILVAVGVGLCLKDLLFLGTIAISVGGSLVGSAIAMLSARLTDSAPEVRSAMQRAYEMIGVPLSSDWTRSFEDIHLYLCSMRDGTRNWVYMKLRFTNAVPPFTPCASYKYPSEENSYLFSCKSLQTHLIVYCFRVDSYERSAVFLFPDMFIDDLRYPIGGFCWHVNWDSKEELGRTLISKEPIVLKSGDANFPEGRISDPGRCAELDELWQERRGRNGALCPASMPTSAPPPRAKDSRPA